MAPTLKLSASIFAVVALTTSVQAEDPAAWPDFFASIGGSTDINVVGKTSPEAQPLRERPAEIVGARFFMEKKAKDPFLIADRGHAAFKASCAAREGALVDGGDERVREFVDRVSSHLTRPSGHKHEWRAKGAICEDAEGSPLAGYLAVLQDNTAVAARGDPGSRLISSMFGLRTTTAVYLFRPGWLQSRAAVEHLARAEEDRVAREEARVEAERRQAEAFRRNLAIGDETNCGTVIEIRGPIAEIALPINRRAPNGEATFWTRIERLAPRGIGTCTFGL